MANSLVFACKDAGVQCNARITGDSQEEVVAKAVEHARHSHGVDLTQSRTLMRYVQSSIRDTRAAQGR